MVSVIVVMVDAAASVRVGPATPTRTGHRGDRLGRAKAIVAIEGERSNRAIADLGQRDGGKPGIGEGAGNGRTGRRCRRIEDQRTGSEVRCRRAAAAHARAGR